VKSLLPPGSKVRKFFAGYSTGVWELHPAAIELLLDQPEGDNCFIPVAILAIDPLKRLPGARMPDKVFISHSSKDKEIADAICQHLESAGRALPDRSA
jgi:hypothetical protein